MRRNDLLSFVLTVILCMLILVACTRVSYDADINDQHIKEQDSDHITIYLSSSMAEKKLVTNIESIERIIAHIDGIEKEQIAIEEEIYGWEISVKVGTPIKRTVLFVGTLMQDNGVWYQVSENEISEFRELCSNLKYSE